MKHVLLPDVRYYKANLHAHSVISDGRTTPEEMKRRYKAHGYSVIAYTDHEVFLRHNDLTDENFLAMNGYEVGVYDYDRATNPKEYRQSHPLCHLCLVALSPDVDTAVCVNEADVRGNARDHFSEMKTDEDAKTYRRVYSADCINDIIRRAREAGFFVTYNHPTWSVERYPQYSAYENMHAMEIVNYGCVTEGFPECNDHCYDDLLDQGKRVFCIATDDNHNKYAEDDPKYDSYGGYTLIAADRLDYASVAGALKAGRFYCATGTPGKEGPKIRSLIFEDDAVTIRAEGARKIDVQTGIRLARSAAAPLGKTIDEARFDLPENFGWFRVTLTDENGFHAYSNAYFRKDLQ